MRLLPRAPLLWLSAEAYRAQNLASDAGSKLYAAQRYRANDAVELPGMPGLFSGNGGISLQWYLGASCAPDNDTILSYFPKSIALPAAAAACLPARLLACWIIPALYTYMSGGNS